MMKVLVEDKYNKNKQWEITHLKGGYYLREFICGRQFGRGCRTTKKWLDETGIAYMKPVRVTIKKGRYL